MRFCVEIISFNFLLMDCFKSPTFRCCVEMISLLNCLMFCFFQPILCEGHIEIWLSSFLTTLKGALQFQLATAMGVEKPVGRPREIHSAGARRVAVSGSRAGSSARPGTRGESTYYPLLKDMDIIKEYFNNIIIVYNVFIICFIGRIEG